MRKIYILLLAILIGGSASAQVTVTLIVDVTDYAAGGNTIDANGIHVAGNFMTVGSTTITADWAPDNAAGALTDNGDGTWSISITFPETAIGDTLQFKFLNGNDWGVGAPNIEGQADTTTLTDACGINDGFGGYNRYLIIPSNDITLKFCWDQCVQCDGSDPFLGINENNIAVSNISILPNPFFSTLQINYTLQNAGEVSLKVINLKGEVVETIEGGNQGAGIHVMEIDGDNLPAGNYFYRLQAGTDFTSGTIMKQ